MPAARRPPRRAALVAVLGVALAGCGAGTHARPVGAPAAHVSAWPEASGDAAHTSPTGATGPQTARLAWTRRLGGWVGAGPVVGRDGSLLVSSTATGLHALDPATGRDRWTVPAPGPAGEPDLSTSPAVLGDGTVLWPYGSTLTAVSAAGRRLWSQPFAGDVLSPALGSGGRVYVADMAGHLSALDPGVAGPGLAWTVTTEPMSFGSPAVAADGTIYTTAGPTLYAVTDEGDRARVRWRYRTASALEVSPAVAPDGTVVLGTDAGVEQGVSAIGRTLWSTPLRTGVFSYSSPVVARGLAWFGDNDGVLRGVDPRDGTVRVRAAGLPPQAGLTRAGVGIWTAPVVDARGDVYVGTARDQLEAFGPDGTSLWTLDTDGIMSGYPALTASGLLVAGSSGGTLYAVGG